MLAAGDQLVAHAWVAFHDGTGWREIDPTNGELSVGAGHPQVSTMDFLALLSVGDVRVVELGPADKAKPSAGPAGAP